MSDVPSETPPPLRQVASDLSARAETLAAEVAAARSRVNEPRPASPQAVVPGVPQGSAGGFADVMALRSDAAFRGVERAVSEVQSALDVSPPTSLPDNPSELEGDEVAQAFLVSDLLASYDAERDEEGHLTSRAAKEAYGLWATRRDELDGPVREHLTGLAARLDDAADTAASYLLPPPAPHKPGIPERTGSSWI